MSMFVVEANKLKNIQMNLQKSEKYFIEHLTKDDVNFKEFCSETTSERMAGKETIQKEIRNLFENLSVIKALVVKDNIDDIDIKFVKKEMTQIQKTIENAKRGAKEALENLQDKASELYKEMEMFEQQTKEWNKPINIELSNRLSIKHNFTANSKNIPQEVQDFLKYVSNGGHTNGWSSEDHQLFLKSRAKYKDTEKMANNLQAVLPDITTQEITEHEIWYQKYLELKTKQRDIIRNWRINKSQACISTENKQQQMKRCISSYSQSKLNFYKRDDIKEKIATWKEEKQEEQQRQKEIELQNTLKNKQVEARKQNEHRQIKETVVKWKQKKTVRSQAEKLEQIAIKRHEQDYKSTTANKLIKQFQCQDNVYLERMKEMRKPQLKSIGSIQPRHSALRDPERLFKPTKQWICRTTQAKEASNKNLNIKMIPKLCVPDWRKSIS